MFATKGFKIDDLRLNGNPKILIKILVLLLLLDVEIM
jgi:hypothetical protein